MNTRFKFRSICQVSLAVAGLLSKQLPRDRAGSVKQTPSNEPFTVAELGLAQALKKMSALEDLWCLTGKGGLDKAVGTAVKSGSQQTLLHS